MTISAFDRDVKTLKKKHYRLDLLLQAIHAVVTGNRDVLSTVYRDHALTGDWKGYRELHVSGDWLLIYCIEGNGMILVLTRSSTHDDLYTAKTSGRTIRHYRTSDREHFLR